MSKFVKQEFALAKCFFFQLQYRLIIENFRSIIKNLIVDNFFDKSVNTSVIV